MQIFGPFIISRLLPNSDLDRILENEYIQNILGNLLSDKVQKGEKFYFAALKRLKNYLRSTTEGNRLCSLSVLYIEL